jgi:hypothetical protein
MRSVMHAVAHEHGLDFSRGRVELLPVEWHSQLHQHHGLDRCGGGVDDLNVRVLRPGAASLNGSPSMLCRCCGLLSTTR